MSYTTYLLNDTSEAEVLSLFQGYCGSYDISEPLAEICYRTHYVPAGICPPQRCAVYFLDTLYEKTFMKVICLARSSTIESVKIIIITLLQKLISAAAGFNCNHYFKLFCQTKSLSVPKTFCQLMVTPH